jgi:toxin FitB
MIILDTNVVSEAMTRAPNASVRAWLDAQAPETLFLSSITVAELHFGVGVLPNGKRKQALAAALSETLDQFGDRILPFDANAARRYAGLAIKARTEGKGFPLPDASIAGIAASNGFAVASRDASAFTSVGISVINPWTGPGTGAS